MFVCQRKVDTGKANRQNICLKEYLSESGLQNHQKICGESNFTFVPPPKEINVKREHLDCVACGETF
jgi:hypothetical protein